MLFHSRMLPNFARAVVHHAGQSIISFIEGHGTGRDIRRPCRILRAATVLNRDGYHLRRIACHDEEGLHLEALVVRPLVSRARTLFRKSLTFPRSTGRPQAAEGHLLPPAQSQLHQFWPIDPAPELIRILLPRVFETFFKDADPQGV